MHTEPEGGLLSPREHGGNVPHEHGAHGYRRAAVDCLSIHRAWDLHPGDCLHGRIIASVRGVVGLACSPVAVFSFTGDDPEHTAQTRIGAAHPDMELGCDDVWRAARAWVRGHGLHEGEPVDLDRLRAEVLGVVAQG